MSLPTIIFLFRSIANTYSMYTYGNKRIFPYVSYSVATDYLTNTVKLTSSTTDSNGNPSVVTETFNDGSYNRINYSNYTNAGSWMAARPLNMTVTRKHYDDASTFSLSTAYTYNSTTGKVLTEATGPLTSTYQYNGNGTVSQVTLSDGSSSRTTRFEYDSKGRFATKVYNAQNHLTQRTFDSATGNVLTETAPNNQVTSYTYDNFGRPTTTSYPTGQSVSTSYQWATGSRPKNAVYYTLTTSSGLPSVKEYLDAFGRVLRTEESGASGGKATMYQQCLQCPWADGPTKLPLLYRRSGLCQRI